MKALAIKYYAEGSLESVNLPEPPLPGPNQIQLALIGTSINPFDQKLVTGYGAPLFNPRKRFPIVPGRDAVATVANVGKNVTGYEVGQRVVVASSARIAGTYAERFNVPAKCTTPITDSRLSIATAAALGYSGLTAMQSLASAGLTAKTSKGKKICIHGASGGVGSIALVLASAWGAHITATASPRNHTWIRSLCDCSVIDYADATSISQIEADIVLNFAASASAMNDPLIDILKRSNAKGKAYATVMHPLLENITERGKFKGLLASGALLIRKKRAYAKSGVNYSWVVFKENPEHLSELVSIFSQARDINVVGSQGTLTELPHAFNTDAPAGSPGKSVFVGKP